MFGCDTHLLKHIKQAILGWSFRQILFLGCYPVFPAISAPIEFIVTVGQIFVVHSESDEQVFYEVNMAMGECQCSRGATRGQCKHKFAITHYYKIAAFSALPANDPGMRATWDYVGTGVVRPAHRYRGLADEEHDGPGVEEFVQQQRQRGHSPAESNR